MTGRLTYAIGDVHGRLDLLQAALDAVARHGAGSDVRLVLLGDYIDRGPESRGVVDLLMGLQRDAPLVCLKGNHEDLMVRAIRDGKPADVRLWLREGGDRTLASYGAASLEEAAVAVPAEHLRWMSRLPLTTADARRVYVHAGLSPQSPMDAQDERTCLWIRDVFLAAEAGAFEQHVVHGHTPLWRDKPEMDRPELLDHRTNLDTGAYQTGVLCVGVFPRDTSGGPLEVIRVSARASGPPAVDLLPGAPPPPVAPPPRRSRWPSLLRR